VYVAGPYSKGYPFVPHLTTFWDLDELLGLPAPASGDGI
jgi:hypothetical protein